ncbi:MAG: HDIG domain-containing protein [Thermoplasmata archaeon]|nr:HDIG domain-containing protein [Thermoplasmata archaeon]
MDLEVVFPLLKEIRDEELREKVKKCYEIAMERGGWNNLEEIPFTLLVQDAYSYVKHVNNVAKMAYEIGRVRGDLDMDILIAGALLHDVGKLLEYEKRDGKVVKSDFGKYIRHPVSGAAIAMEVGLDEKIVNIIAAHSKEGEFVERCKEAIVIHHCDFIDFEIVRGEK